MYDSLSLKITPQKLTLTGNFRWVSNLHKECVYDDANRYWLKDKFVGEPSPSNVYTVEQMEEMGMVGIYVSEAN